MALTTYNCTALTGGAARALDSYSVDNLVDGDRAICAVGGELLYFMFDADGTDAENVSSHPYKVRPDDYVDQGVWIEQECVQNPVTASAALTDNTLIRGDGGAKGVQESTIVVSDDGEMTNPSQPCFLIQNDATQENIAVDTDLTIILDVEIFDVGNNFASNTFTAPITGKYQFNLTSRVDKLDTAAAWYFIKIVTSNREHVLLIDPEFPNDPSYWNFNISILTDMDVNDTAHIEIKQSGGEAQADIEGSKTSFSGVLIC